MITLSFFARQENTKLFPWAGYSRSKSNSKHRALINTMLADQFLIGDKEIIDCRTEGKHQKRKKIYIKRQPNLKKIETLVVKYHSAGIEPPTLGSQCKRATTALQWTY